MLQVYDEPTVLLAKRVTGEEEVPEGCVAVVTPDAPDVLSHVSVRARNMRVLFAICHENAPLEEIEKLAGKVGDNGEFLCIGIIGQTAAPCGCCRC